jgi:ornithine--oxo-acid transaminase
MALKVLIEEGMVDNAARMGSRMMSGLSAIQGSAIKEVRGRGLMLAVELHPEAGGARRFCQMLQTRGLLCKETHDHTIRIAPPLVITPDQVDWALEQFHAVLRG